MKRVILLSVVLLFLLSGDSMAQPVMRLASCSTGIDPTTTAFSNVFGGAANFKAITGAASKKIRILYFWLHSTAAVTLKFVEGTGSNCATGGTDFTGIFHTFAVTTSIDSNGMYIPMVASTALDDVCVAAGGASTISGFFVSCTE